MKRLIAPKHPLAESPAAVLAFVKAKPVKSICIVTEPALWEAGLLEETLSMLAEVSVPVKVDFAAAQDADLHIAVGGHGALAALPRRGRCCHLPMVAAEERACLHLLAHGLAAALSCGARAVKGDNAAEACADIIRALRSCENGLNEAAWREICAASVTIARCGRQSLSHELAAALASLRAEGVTEEDALHGPAHETATLAALPIVLAHMGESARRRLSFIAQLAGLASQGAGDDVSAAALLTWLREQSAALQVPQRFPHIPRRAVYELALQVERTGCCDRFTAQELLRPLAAPQEPLTDAKALVELQRAYFRSNATLPLSVRKDALIRLQRCIRRREHDIADALLKDLGKSREESYLCEIGMVLDEIRHMIAHMGRYARQRRVPTPIHQFPATSRIIPRPYGVALVMAPWNYPFLLSMNPLIGAIAAGNTCIVKPSAYAPATSRILRELIGDCFPQEHAAVIEGGRAENQALLDQPFDRILFTGGETVGREVLRRAAEHLTPVVLELGGKSPVIVDATADIPLAARRIAFGKLLNAGQTCIAPDYILAERSVAGALVEALKAEFTAMAGENALQNETFPHMISERHYHRVMGLIDQAKVVYGGRGDLNTLRIQPTLLEGASAQDAAMQEEIFGPVLPIIEVENVEEAVDFIRSRPTPLALYLFTKDRAVKRRVLAEVPFGGGCVNDTIVHLSSRHLPFGGLGRSGMGHYHGRYSFDCFSHLSGVIDRAAWLDLPMRYAPRTEKKMKLVRFFLK